VITLTRLWDVNPYSRSALPLRHLTVLGHPVFPPLDKDLRAYEYGTQPDCLCLQIMPEEELGHPFEIRTESADRLLLIEQYKHRKRIYSEYVVCDERSYYVISGK
jgi:hypothetical protein